MADKQETVADIVEDLREFAGHTKGQRYSGSLVGALAKRIAERIEAAEKRAAEQPGNAKELREALERLREWAALDMLEHAIGTDEVNYRKLADGILKISNSAIAAPPRNCDRFANAADALQAFEQAVSPRWRADWEQKDWVKFAKWLFATTWDGKEPATKEGAE